MAYTLRVSVIDNCQLRCRYCLPDGPQELLHKQYYLNERHYETVASTLKYFAINKIRFTGGEPLLRKDLPAIVRAFAKLGAPMAITTNGLRFVAMKDALIEAGITATTFHLDTLREEKYTSLMGRGTVRAVMEAIDAACASGLLVKINVVVQKGLNDDELVDFLHLSKSRAIEVRFIEQMNTGSARDHVARTFMSGAAILARLQESTPIVARKRVEPSAPAEQHYAEELDVVFGMIASDTRPFCADCDRLRINADGRVRTCLYEPRGVDVGFGDDDADVNVVRANFLDVIQKKRSYHPSMNLPRPDFAMAQIGG